MLGHEESYICLTKSSFTESARYVIPKAIRPASDWYQISHKAGNFALNYRIISQDAISFPRDIYVEVLE